MIPRHPALSVELRSEADDLRRYACELKAAGDAAGACAVRDKSMHVEGWVDHVVELEESAASFAVVLDELDLRDVDKLALAVDTMRAEYDVELRPVFPASSCVDVAEVPAAGKRALASFVGPLGEVRRMVEAAAARGVA